MTLEEQVASLELSKKLNELGIKQESLLYWIQVHGEGNYILKEDWWAIDNRRSDYPKYSAFTVAELGEMFPKADITKEIKITSTFFNPFFYVYLERLKSEDIEKYGEIIHDEKGIREADARAKMLIYLIENKFMNL